MEMAEDGDVSGLAGSPYLEAAPRLSRGRVTLTQAFEQYCLMRFYIMGEEIASALAPQGGSDRDRESVRLGVELVAGLFFEGRFPTWARPLGGGPVEEIPAGHWELDDFAPRFATGSINMRRPFDPDAEPTHSIFVDRSTLQELLDACCVDDPHYAEAVRRRVLIAPPVATDGAATEGVEPKYQAVPGSGDDGYLRMREVMRLTGLARSTVYARIARDAFPAGYDLGGGVTGWHIGEVKAWLEARRNRG